MATQYYELLDAVKAYYGSGSDQWLEIAQHGLTGTDAASILKQVPGVNVTTNKAGSILSYSLDTSIPLNDGGVAAGAINSNAQTGTAAAVNNATTQTVGNFTKDAQTGNVSVTDNIPKNTGGVAGTAKAVAATVSTVITGASIGASLGKTINSAIYNQNPNYWSEVLDTPEPGSTDELVWKAITNAVDTIDPDGQILHTLNALVGWDDGNDKSTMYISEDAYAYYAYKLAQSGFFDGEFVPTDYSDIGPSGQVSNYTISPAPIGQTLTNALNLINEYYGHEMFYSGIYNGLADFIGQVQSLGGNIAVAMQFSTPNQIYAYAYDIGNNSKFQITRAGDTHRLVLYRTSGSYPSSKGGRRILGANDGSYEITVASGISYPSTLYTYDGPAGSMLYTPYIICGTTVDMPGTGTQTGATTPNTSSWTDPTATKQSLQQQYLQRHNCIG